MSRQLFFDEASVESLGEAIARFERMKFESSDCQKQAEKFSKERFNRELSRYLFYLLH